MKLDRFFLILHCLGMNWTAYSFGSTARADQFHFQNVVIGVRAMGLGGAFTGLATDSSGIYYNPGGMAFIESEEVSASVNTRYLRRVTHKEVFDDEDFEELSEGSAASFFGLHKRLDNLCKRCVAAFSLYSPDSELQDQNTHIENNASHQIVRFHRAQNVRSNTFHAGGALAIGLGESLGVGMGVTYVTVDELVQSYQDSRLGPFTMAGNEGRPVYSNFTRNIRSQLNFTGVEPVVGIRLRLGGSLTLGLSYKRLIFLSQKYAVDLEETSVQTDADNQVLRPEDFGGVESGVSGKLVRPSLISAESTEVFDSEPTELRVGFAWQPAKSFLWSTDVSHRPKVSASSHSLGNFSRGATTNYAAGVEILPAQWATLRFGAFTNYDAAPKVSGSRLLHRGEYIDYFGASFFFALHRKSSEYALGVVAQQGNGKAIKVPGQVNNVVGEILTGALLVSSAF